MARELKKELGLLDVFAVAAGAMISSGLFILPGIAFAQAGPGVILSYLLASVVIVPSILSKAELATAMPKAGGTYFFVERSLGSMWGLFSGFAAWFSLALKSAFAIVGMAALIEVVLQQVLHTGLSPWHLKEIAVVCCVFFVALNIVSVKQTGRFQTVLVGMLLAMLTYFIIAGAGASAAIRYQGFWDKGVRSMLTTAGLVFISYGGVTKVASIAEEVEKPGRNLPLGMLLAWGVVSVFYVVVIIITVGLVDGEELAVSYMPISLAASKFAGTAGFVILSIAAITAFVTTANGGILAASRAPMAMSRDRLLPGVLARVGQRFKTPHISIILTGVFMIAAIVLLDMESLVKTASTLMILLFVFDNASVIMMRESRIQSYRPLFKSPLYPYIHVAAIVAYLALIVDMGAIPLSITGAFVVISAGWYLIYVRKRVRRASAAMHVVERVTDMEIRTVTLENELRDILLERDNVIADRFDKLIRDCKILDLKGERTAEKVFRQVSSILAERLDTDEYVLFEKFLRREAESGTVVQPGFAIPHVIVEGEHKFDVVLVRAPDGIQFAKTAEPVRIMFVLAGSKDERNYHLRALMAIAQIAQEVDFETKWLAARDVETIRNLILLSARTRDAG